MAQKYDNKEINKKCMLVNKIIKQFRILTIANDIEVCK